MAFDDGKTIVIDDREDGITADTEEPVVSSSGIIAAAMVDDDVADYAAAAADNAAIIIDDGELCSCCQEIDVNDEGNLCFELKCKHKICLDCVNKYAAFCKNNPGNSAHCSRCNGIFNPINILDGGSGEPITIDLTQLGNNDDEIIDLTTQQQQHEE